MVTKLFTIPLQTICRLRFQTSTSRAAHTAARVADSDLAASLEEKLNAELPTKTNNGATIYRVPDRLHAVEPKAYEPSIVSIGPYHHGAPRLQAMENTKWNFFHRLFNPTKPNRPNLNALVNELKHIEHKARGCYSEELKLSSKQFINMMLIDSCFIVELLREAKEIDFSKKSILLKRWMLPVLQRDLIMLENQLPLFVLNKVYKLTSSEDTEEPGLKKLSYQFFESMIYRDSDTPHNNELGDEKDCGSHFLEQFRASICPTEVLESKFRVKEPHMFRSLTELKESGIKLKKAEKCQPLDVSFEKGVLKIAPVSMDDHKFTLFRNMVAFEQCHFSCKPHVTAYIFFLDRLINSAEDIELLHYAGVVQHTLGGNKHAARLVNNLCKEVAGAGYDSYLQDVLQEINDYCDNLLHHYLAKLKHEYFYNIWVSLSTVAAIVLIYLTILQTVYALGATDARGHMNKHGWKAVIEAFVVPFTGLWWPFEDSSMPGKENSQIENSQLLVIIF
ncbi:hypothetical protein CTI12_AA238560 [Artemisia annua]|uniref:Uncharacterized protein n=1 Tax=Artemisia annua TaxID=35608 RepID=A0A2U1NQL2_ARTAN|nr:hypothetical protein CTI12_AA238560 [Artemisia annua]